PNNPISMLTIDAGWGRLDAERAVRKLVEEGFFGDIAIKILKPPSRTDEDDEKRREESVVKKDTPLHHDNVPPPGAVVSLPPTWKCDQCGQELGSAQALGGHVRWCSSRRSATEETSGEWRCPHCERVFKRHARRNATHKTICKKKLDEQHLMPHKCPHCPLGFRTLGGLRMHTTVAHPETKDGHGDAGSSLSIERRQSRLTPPVLRPSISSIPSAPQEEALSPVRSFVRVLLKLEGHEDDTEITRRLQEEFSTLFADPLTRVGAVRIATEFAKRTLRGLQALDVELIRLFLGDNNET
ncbi:MAG: C2H2-type zinc finger protein, partial [Nanoarchaeota archaeon]|nr:C2H2-type zinc finger protein [Nanoarchaeota archaeon]